MRYLLLFLLSFSAYGDLDGPEAITKPHLDNANTRVVEFGRIMAYMENQAIYDVVEHFAYLQNRDQSNLKLTKRQRADLLKYIDRYYRIAKAHNLKKPLNIAVTCPRCKPPLNNILRSDFPIQAINGEKSLIFLVFSLSVGKSQTKV